jgi:hypothetical protein
MKKLLILAVFFFGTITLYAQGELNEQQKVFFRNEKSFAILLNSDGLGVSYRAAKRIDFRNKNLYEIDAGSLRNIKEYRQESVNVQGSSFIFGKVNTTFFLRGGIGHQHELYKKADLGGIAVRYFYSAGPVLAIYKPIYYRVIHLVPSTPNEYELKDEKFDVATIASPQDIYSKASFFKGFDQLKALPGLYGKVGFNFEYSKADKIIHAIEIGGQVNAFPKKVPIMAGNNNKALFFSLFVSYRFGIILDPLDPESNKLSNIFKRKKNY